MSTCKHVLLNLRRFSLLHDLTIVVFITLHSFIHRAEKTEVLSDDLHKLESWVEQLRSIGLTTQKKIQGCLRAGSAADREKKLVRSRDETLHAFSCTIQSCLLINKQQQLLHEINTFKYL